MRHGAIFFEIDATVVPTQAKEKRQEKRRGSEGEMGGEG